MGNKYGKSDAELEVQNVLAQTRVEHNVDLSQSVSTFDSAKEEVNKILTEALEVGPYDHDENSNEKLKNTFVQGIEFAKQDYIKAENEIQQAINEVQSRNEELAKEEYNSFFDKHEQNKAAINQKYQEIKDAAIQFKDETVRHAQAAKEAIRNLPKDMSNKAKVAYYEVLAGFTDRQHNKNIQYNQKQLEREKSIYDKYKVVYDFAQKIEKDKNKKLEERQLAKGHMKNAWRALTGKKPIDVAEALKDQKYQEKLKKSPLYKFVDEKIKPKMDKLEYEISKRTEEINREQHAQAYDRKMFDQKIVEHMPEKDRPKDMTQAIEKLKTIEKVTEKSARDFDDGCR